MALIGVGAAGGGAGLARILQGQQQQQGAQLDPFVQQTIIDQKRRLAQILSQQSQQPAGTAVGTAGNVLHQIGAIRQRGQANQATENNAAIRQREFANAISGGAINPNAQTPELQQAALRQMFAKQQADTQRQQQVADAATAQTNAIARLDDAQRFTTSERRGRESFTAGQNELLISSRETIAASKSSSGGGKLTEGQRKFATFARLAGNANDKVLGIQNSEGFDPTLVKPDELNFLRTPSGQQYSAAKRAFIDAIIRPMTGAAVTEQEFDSADKRYFPRFGDGEDTVSFKNALRKEAIDAVKAGSTEAFAIINGDTATASVSLPEGVTEEDIEFTMQETGLSREEVLRRIAK